MEREIETLKSQINYLVTTKKDQMVAKQKAKITRESTTI